MEMEILERKAPSWPDDPAAYLPYRVVFGLGMPDGENISAWFVYRYDKVWDGPLDTEMAALRTMRERAAEDGLIEPGDGVVRPLSNLGFCHRLLEKANRLLLITRVGIPRHTEEGVEECFNLHVVTQEANPQAYWLLGRARHLLPYDYDDRRERLCLGGAQYSKTDEICEALSESVYGRRDALRVEVL